MKKMITPWTPTLAFLTDMLSIVTLKSIILGNNNPEKKQSYELEAREIMAKIDQVSGKRNVGRFIRAVQLDMLANRLIWENETLVRLGRGRQNKRLPLTHSINGLRMRSQNAMTALLGGRKDLNLDRLNEDLCRKFGFDFGGLFE